MRSEGMQENSGNTEARRAGTGQGRGPGSRGQWVFPVINPGLHGGRLCLRIRSVWLLQSWQPHTQGAIGRTPRATPWMETETRTVRGLPIGRFESPDPGLAQVSAQFPSLEVAARTLLRG